MSSICCSKFLFVVFVAAFGCGFQHGFHAGVSNIPAHDFQDWLKRVKTERLKGKKPPEEEIQTLWSTITAVFAVGGFLGALLTGYFSERYGRKKSLFWNNFIVLGAIGLIIWSNQAESPELLITGRFLAGINVGLNSGICQIYLVEIAPDSIRGFIAGLYSVFTDCGIIVSQITGMFLGTEQCWHLMFLVPLIPVFIQLFFLPICPESPKHLVIGKDKEDEAEKALIWLRGKDDASKNMKAIIEEDNLVKEMHAGNLKRLFTDIKLRTPLIICIILSIGQRLCGINCVVHFSENTFEQLGLKTITAKVLTVSLGTLMLIMDLISISIVDRLGRRKLLLISFMGMAIETIALTITMIVASQGNSSKFWIVTSVMLYFVFIFFFGIGVGTIPNFITAEIFNHSTRPVAVSLATSVKWLSSFLVSQAFMPLKDVIGYYVFGVFIVLDFFFYFFTNMYLPETTALSPKSLIKLFDYLE